MAADFGGGGIVRHRPLHCSRHLDTNLRSLTFLSLRADVHGHHRLRACLLLHGGVRCRRAGGECMTIDPLGFKFQAVACRWLACLAHLVCRAGWPAAAAPASCSCDCMSSRPLHPTAPGLAPQPTPQARGMIALVLDVIWLIFWLTAAACASAVLSDGLDTSKMKASVAFSWISL